ncbi:UNKNOWN [Stylonychia lemnae]|uniref:Armadillo-type fold n=1 Tax=Stylonychia lemnae TaxID=5949 RepID=A0A077ZY23_STYLE|nr:UNKNOWN [Stylonychia lemnae]|eukprot:CDW74517.1 UNKNOWN [Stylonychia lemnae]
MDIGSQGRKSVKNLHQIPPVFRLQTLQQHHQAQLKNLNIVQIQLLPPKAIKKQLATERQSKDRSLDKSSKFSKKLQLLTQHQQEFRVTSETLENKLVIIDHKNISDILLSIQTLKKINSSQLKKMLELIQNCSTNEQAFQFFNYLQSSKWSQIKYWMLNLQSKTSRRIIIEIISEVIQRASDESKGISLDKDQDQKILQQEKVQSQLKTARVPRIPLGNITNTFNPQPLLQQSNSMRQRQDSGDKENQCNIPTISNKQQSISTSQSYSTLPKQNIQKSYFTKEHLFSIIFSKDLVELLKHYSMTIDLNSPKKELLRQDCILVSKIMFQIADSILMYYKKQNLYDQYSFTYIKNGIFPTLITLLKIAEFNFETMSVDEQKYISRCLEFCSTHSEGLNLIYTNREMVFYILKSFMKENVNETQVLYATATVLLDLTANEDCLEKVAQLMRDHNLLEFVYNKLNNFIRLNPQDSQYQKLRDLFIGILLNLACNVENQQIISEMILGTQNYKQGVLPLLTMILLDSRHDWPTNGAALALLQYCHQGLQQADIYEAIQQAKIKEIAQMFIEKCNSKDAKKHLYEILTILEICGKKMDSITLILKTQVYASCA